MSENEKSGLAKQGEWDLDFSNENKGGEERKKTEWMKFPKPGTYKVRLVGPYVWFYRHQKPFEGERVITDLTQKADDPAWQAGFYPRKTYAIHIIDRADGKLKILEKGTSVFNAFATYKKVNDINPAGKEAPDFSIEVKWPDGNKFQAKYTVTALAKLQTLTDEEIEMFKSGKAPLPEIYKSTPIEKIQELWEALPEEKRVPPKKDEAAPAAKPAPAKKPAAPIEEDMPEAPAEKDDLFGEKAEGEEQF
jgi:hypothetical protein